MAKRLKQARLAMGLSQKMLGIAAAIDEFSASPRMNQYERGKHIPDYQTLERIAEVLNVPLPYFYAVDDELANLILAFHQLDQQNREKISKEINSHLNKF